ncbi:MAG: hypothetical protein MH137_01985 [Flavobacteriales bacterium]|nr:hypothetical protein [Flavobacteriales bacterium]
MHKILTIALSFLLIFGMANAQKTKSVIKPKKKTNMGYFEVYAGVGVTNFLGDLGGANQIGTNFAKDLDIQATRPVMTIGGRYFYHPWVAQRVSVSYGWLRGDDKWTKEEPRFERNLNFRTPIVEIATAFEVHILRDTPPKNRYQLTGIKPSAKKNIGLYLFAGVGGFYFNPKGQNLNTGEWVNLKPLRTEGQGYIPNRKEYSLWQVSIPMGLGFTYRFDKNWKLGLDLGLRKTFTDYIDDVSTNYVDPAMFNLNGSPDPALSTYFSSGKYTGQSDGLPGSGNVAGQQRGDPKDKDAFMFLTVNVTYRFNKKGLSVPKFF